MYFRKSFEGVTSNTTYTGNVYIYGISKYIKTYISQTQVINEAIKETLLAAGVHCEYDITRHVLCIDGVYAQVLVTSANGTLSVYARGIETVFNPANYAIWSGNNYRFQVTLQGDPKGILLVNVGYYSYPGYLNNVVAIAKLMDLRDNSRKLGVIPGCSLSVYVYDASGAQMDGIYTLQFSPLDNNPVLTDSGSRIPLLESIDSTGFFKIEQCYMGHKGLNTNSFHNIGGDIYYHIHYYYLVRCTTEIS